MNAPATPGKGADKDALINELGATLVRDARVLSAPWDSYALVARFEQARLHLNGFGYADDGPGRPLTPEDPEVPRLLEALRAATRAPERAAWSVCVVQVTRATGKLAVHFEYEHPELWEVTPQRAAEVAERARP